MDFRPHPDICDGMRNKDWDRRFTGSCYFYPARDCPGWKPGTKCGRVDQPIPEDADAA